MRGCWFVAVPMLAVALRVPPAPARSAASMSAAIAQALSSSLGKDPRTSTLSEERLGQLAEASAREVNAASVSSSDAVRLVLTLEDFEAAVERGAATGKLTVFKFYAPWCRTCASIKNNYMALAEGVMPKKMRYKMQAGSSFADVCDFHEIEYTAARPLCAQCNITSMPVVHVYAGGQLQLCTKLAKTSFVGFCNKLAQCTDYVMLGIEPET